MTQSDNSNHPRRKKQYVRAVGPRLRIALWVVFGLVALLGANSTYLISVTFLEWFKGLNYQNYFYQYMFLAHLALGLLLIGPFLLFAFVHMWNARQRQNRRAVRVGYALFAMSLALLVSGVILTRLGSFELKNPGLRSIAYWAHVVTPVVALWLYVLHRLAGPKIKWRIGLAGSAAVLGLVAAMVWFHTQDPREWNAQGPREGERYFHPSLARTTTGNFIPAKVLMTDD